MYIYMYIYIYMHVKKYICMYIILYFWYTCELWCVSMYDICSCSSVCLACTCWYVKCVCQYENTPVIIIEAQVTDLGVESTAERIFALASGLAYTRAQGGTTCWNQFEMPKLLFNKRHSHCCKDHDRANHYIYRTLDKETTLLGPSWIPAWWLSYVSHVKSLFFHIIVLNMFKHVPTHGLWVENAKHRRQGTEAMVQQLADLYLGQGFLPAGSQTWLGNHGKTKSSMMVKLCKNHGTNLRKDMFNDMFEFQNFWRKKTGLILPQLGFCSSANGPKE